MTGAEEDSCQILFFVTQTEIKGEKIKNKFIYILYTPFSGIFNDLLRFRKVRNVKIQNIKDESIKPSTYISKKKKLKKKIQFFFVIFFY